MSGRPLTVKICGLTRVEEAEFLNRCGADLAGMVLFFPNSKRNITLEQATAIRGRLKEETKSVAVTVSPDLEQALLIREAGFDYLQVHGELREEVLAAGLPVIRALHIEKEEDRRECAALEKDERVAAFLFDAAKPGSGKTFDWSYKDDIPQGEKPVFLAGGLTVENVEEAVRVFAPDGVDVSSGVEREGAVFLGKDEKKVEAFVAAARRAERERQFQIE